MKDHNGNHVQNEYFESGRQCTYCRVLRSHEYELCRYCGVYKQGLAYMAELRLGNEKPSVGELLARFDFASREMIKLFCQAGLDREQIESIMDKIIRDNIKSLAVEK